MMPDFMRDDVSAGKIPGSLKSILKFLEKAHVEINLLVLGTIEWPHSCLRKSARGFYRTRKQDKLWFPVCFTRAPKQVGPRVFGICQNGRNEFFVFLICRRCGRRAVCFYGGARSHFVWVDTEVESNDQQNHAPN